MKSWYLSVGIFSCLIEYQSDSDLGMTAVNRYFHIPQSSSLTIRLFRSSYTGHSLMLGSYPSAEMHSVYSTAQRDRTLNSAYFQPSKSSTLAIITLGFPHLVSLVQTKITLFKFNLPHGSGILKINIFNEKSIKSWYLWFKKNNFLLQNSLWGILIYNVSREIIKSWYLWFKRLSF